MAKAEFHSGIGNSGPSARESAACVDELGWVKVGEFGVEGGEDAGDTGPRPGAESEPAVFGVEVFHDGAAWRPAGHDVSGQVEPCGAGAWPEFTEKLNWILDCTTTRMATDVWSA